ncbi:uncharacterized protein LOC132298815 [Cornus florida]|uniref:uncharacterized protein LOC132298815 n=1 Tax=Cornus florida TaxID=4283 RepID=UPI00289B6A88|nr:uncharacterized protein LOC132298815 [Cornus florida]
MRSISAFFVLFSLLLVLSPTDGRKEAADYWKSIMKEEPMPKAIQDLVGGDPSSFSNENTIKGHTELSESKFTKDFDTTPINILYHSHDHHDHPKEVKPFVN